MSQHDDLFHELSRTLDVSPSRDFADGVRSRIARRRRVMRSAMSGLAIAASLLLVMLVRWPEPSRSIEVLPADKAPVVAVSNVVSPSVAAGSVPQPRRSNRVTRVAEPATEPDPLRVVTNQMAVLQAVWANQQVTGETEAPVVEELPTTGPAPVVIEPVRVLPVVIADQRTPIEGLPIIRRAVAALETK